MVHLPAELIEQVIDWLALIYPQSLLECALVSRNWSFRSKYYLRLLFEQSKITTPDGLYGLLGTFSKYPLLGRLVKTLSISPPSDAATSYIPFHRLSPHLPAVRRLILSETVRWFDYPLLYNRDPVGQSFRTVTSLELSCHFNSLEDLVRFVRSFRNLDEVRLKYDSSLPSWIVPQNKNTIVRARSLFGTRFEESLRFLEVTVSHSSRACDSFAGLLILRDSC